MGTSLKPGDANLRLKPRRALGQHFLIDKEIIKNILMILDPSKDDHLVEIGPGLGALTKQLVKKESTLDAIEIDRLLATKLLEKLPEFENFRLHVADALSFDFRSLKRKQKKFRIIGNLPYNISTSLILQLFDIIDSVEDMHFMLQLEVAKRLTSSPGEKSWGRLAILTQYHCDATKLMEVEPKAFKPKPKIQSALVRLSPKKNKPFQKIDPLYLSNTTRIAFSQRRKTLGNNLKSIIDLRKLKNIGISSTTRAENLTLEQFVSLAKLIYGK